MPVLTSSTILASTSIVAGAAFLVTLRRVRQLEAEIEKLRSSLAVGLAEGYHSNFLRWVARDIAQGRQLTEGGAPSKRKIEKLFVFLPRRLDWEAQDAIARFSRDVKLAGRAVDCHFGDPNPRFRPQILKRCTDHLAADILFDVPTTLQAIQHNLEDEPPLVRDERYREELNRFKDHLESRLREIPHSNMVIKVVLIDDLSTLMDSLPSIAAQFSTP